MPVLAMGPQILLIHNACLKHIHAVTGNPYVKSTNKEVRYVCSYTAKTNQPLNKPTRKKYHDPKTTHHCGISMFSK